MAPVEQFRHGAHHGRKRPEGAGEDRGSEDGATGTVPSSGLDPLLYPWDPPDNSGVLDGDAFLLLDQIADLAEALTDAGAAPLQARSPVVSVGANSSPDVLRRKFAGYHRPVSQVLPMMRGQLHNVGIGHSAHVSRAGYIAAAPYLQPGECTTVWVSWLDDLQLLALDETEPNYRRVRLEGTACPLVLDNPVVLDNGGRPEAFSLYASRWGVLADADGCPLPLMDQPALFGRLASAGAGLDAVGAGGAGTRRDGMPSVFAGPPEAVAANLADPVIQERAKGWFALAGLAAQLHFDQGAAGAGVLSL